MNALFNPTVPVAAFGGESLTMPAPVLPSPVVAPPCPFAAVIGQDEAKNALRLYLEGYEGSGVIPNLMLVGSAGNGKTMLAKELARNLRYACPETGALRTKLYRVVNCVSIKSEESLINDLMIPYVTGKYVTVLFDEASELSEKATMALLTMLNPTPEHRTSYSTASYTVDLDFRMQTFIFATSEPQKVFHALQSRLERIELADYKPCELAKIVSLNFKGDEAVKFEPGVLEAAAATQRGSARGAQKLAIKIKTLLGTKPVAQRGEFTFADWNKLYTALSVLPLGLSNTELRLMRFIAARGGETTLTAMAAATGLTPSAIRLDIESYLLKTGLLVIGTQSKRRLSHEGWAYLRALDAGVGPLFRVT